MPAYTHDFRCASTMSRPMAAPAPALLAQAPQSVLSLQRAALWRRPRMAARACRPALLKSLHSPTLCHAVPHRAAALLQAAGQLRLQRSQSSFQGHGGLFTCPACRSADQRKATHKHAHADHTDPQPAPGARRAWLLLCSVTTLADQEGARRRAPAVVGALRPGVAARRPAQRPLGRRVEQRVLLRRGAQSPGQPRRELRILQRRSYARGACKSYLSSQPAYGCTSFVNVALYYLYSTAFLVQEARVTAALGS